MFFARYRNLLTRDLWKMMKLRLLGIDLRQNIRDTFNLFMLESSELSINSPQSNQQQQLLSVEEFRKLRESVVL